MNDSLPIGTATPAGYAPPRQSPGILLRMNAQGYTQTPTNRGGGSFNHPFRPSLVGMELRLSRGLVNGLEPVIGTKKIPISGDAKHAQPALKLDPDQIDKETQQSWVCLQVTPDKEGRLATADQIEVVQRKSAYAFVGEKGIQPVALVLWKNKRPVRAIDQVWFNLRYITILPPAGQGGRKHYFL
ncbi:MAG: hypothetical protein ABIT76_08595 [Chthoniobacterales bacterium]